MSDEFSFIEETPTVEPQLDASAILLTQVARLVALTEDLSTRLAYTEQMCQMHSAMFDGILKTNPSVQRALEEYFQQIADQVKAQQDAQAEPTPEV